LETSEALAVFHKAEIEKVWPISKAAARSDLNDWLRERRPVTRTIDFRIWQIVLQKSPSGLCEMEV